MQLQLNKYLLNMHSHADYFFDIELQLVCFVRFWIWTFQYLLLNACKLFILLYFLDHVIWGFYFSCHCRWVDCLFMLHWFRNWMYKILVSNKVNHNYELVFSFYVHLPSRSETVWVENCLKKKKKKKEQGEHLYINRSAFLLAILPSPRKILATFQCSKFFFYGFLTWKDIFF